MNRTEIELFRPLIVAILDREDLGDLPRQCGVKRISELLPSVEELVPVLAPIERESMQEGARLVLQMHIRNIGRALGLNDADARQLAIEETGRVVI